MFFYHHCNNNGFVDTSGNNARTQFSDKLNPMLPDVIFLPQQTKKQKQFLNNI